MTVQLIGTSTNGTTNLPIGNVFANQFVCTASGTLTEIKVYCRVDSQVRVALYTDDGSNRVGNLVAESADTHLTTVNAWDSIAVAGGDIVVGTKYWLAVQCATAGGGSYRTATSWWGSKSQAYGAFPANGTGFGYAAPYEMSLQGWGTLAGWANIKNVRMGTGTITATDIAHICMGTSKIDVADISDFNGIAV